MAWGAVRGLGAHPSVGPVGVFGPLELHLEALHADLEPVHGVDGRLRASWIVKADKAWEQRGHGDNGDTGMVVTMGTWGQ